MVGIAFGESRTRIAKAENGFLRYRRSTDVTDVLPYDMLTEMAHLDAIIEDILVFAIRLHVSKAKTFQDASRRLLEP